MANLTLSLDNELLQKARVAAVRDRTSVNALVRDYLARYVDAKAARSQALSELDALAKTHNAKLDGGYERAELHQRPEDS